MAVCISGTCNPQITTEIKSAVSNGKPLNPCAASFTLRPSASEWKPAFNNSTGAETQRSPSKSYSSAGTGSLFDGHPDVPSLSLDGVSFTTGSSRSADKCCDSANATDLDDDVESSPSPQEHKYEDDGEGDVEGFYDEYDDEYVEGYAPGYLPARLYRGQVENTPEGATIDWNQYPNCANWLDDYGNWVMEDQNGFMHEAFQDEKGHWIYLGYSVPVEALPGADKLITDSNDGIKRYEAEKLLSLRAAVPQGILNLPEQLEALAEVASLVLKKPTNAAKPQAVQEVGRRKSFSAQNQSYQEQTKAVSCPQSKYTSPTISRHNSLSACVATPEEPPKYYLKPVELPDSMKKTSQEGSKFYLKSVESKLPKSSGKKGGARRGGRRRGGNTSDAMPSAVSAGPRSTGKFRTPPGNTKFIAEEECKPLDVNDDTRWKPACMRKSAEDETADELIVRKAQSILNKLTVETFDKLSNQLLTVGLKTPEIIAAVIQMVVKKAQAEPSFSNMYAALCLKLSRSALPALEEPCTPDVESSTPTTGCKGGKKFRKMLLACCQAEFEVDQAQALLQLQELDLPAEVLAERSLVLRQAYLGHVKFVGELYKAGLVREQIVHMCIQELFGEKDEPDEEKLASMVKLLSTVGHQLETTASNENYRMAVRGYIKAAKKLSQQKNLTSRIRFMLQDLVELKECNWVPRRAEVIAKTKAQILKEAIQEGKNQSRNNQEGQGFNCSFKSPQVHVLHMPAATEDGWEVVGSSKKKRNEALSTERWKDRQKGMDTCDSNSHTQRERIKEENMICNPSFSQQPQDNSKSRRADVKPCDQQIIWNEDNPKVTCHEIYCEAILESSKHENNEIRVSLDSIFCEDEVKRKGKLAIEEYFVTQDLTEALQCIRDLNAQDHIWQVIIEGINLVLEKTPKEQRIFEEFLIQLHKEGLLTPEHFKKSLADFLNILEDIQIDIPQAGCVLSQIVARGIAEKFLLQDFFKHDLESFHLCSGASQFLLLVCKQLNSVKAHLSPGILEALLDSVDASALFGTESNKDCWEAFCQQCTEAFESA